MIKFIDKDGYTFFGEVPYVHWFGSNLYEQTLNKDYFDELHISGQSTNLQYIKNILILSNNSSLSFSIKSKNSVFHLVDINIIHLIEQGEFIPGTDTKYNFPDALTYQITLSGNQISGGLYVYQLIVNASSPDPGQITEEIQITGGLDDITIKVGADFYDYDEILSINLGNRGTELSDSIQKAIYCSDIKESYTDNILINRKLKELISNYLDIMDNKGSYKSLYNSLKWFEWGDNVTINEIWKRNDRYFEKELENIISEKYKTLLFTHQKTSYISLIAALTKYSLDDQQKIELNEEKLPILENISRIWSNDILGLKISLLGAFFERYFMPIHLSLFNATTQSRVFADKTIKIKSGSLTRTHNWHDDWGVVDIQMDHTVVLGNIKPVSVGRNTVFGYQDIDSTDTHYVHKLAGVTYLTGDSTQTPPIPGVELIDTGHAYDSTDNNELITIWGNIRGHVGVVVPVTVTVPLPEGDALNAETIVIYRYNTDGTLQDGYPLRIFERRLWESGNIAPEEEEPVYAARFTFNLLSTGEEKVSFSLQMHSLSGHTWTAASSYEAIDTKGSKLNAYRVYDKEFTGVFAEDDPWVNSIFSFDGQYNNINENDLNKSILTQYIPTNNSNYLNKLFVIDVSSGHQVPPTSALSDYYVINRGDNKYILCIKKKGGKTFDSFDSYTVVREDYIFIPQLHDFVDIESIPLKTDASGRYIMSYDDYIIDPNTDIVCIIPEIKYSKKIDTNSVNWIFKNMTTGEEIIIDQPQQNPFVLYNDKWSKLTEGYWSVTMNFKFLDSNQMNSISRNSMFLVKKR